MSARALAEAICAEMEQALAAGDLDAAQRAGRRGADLLTDHPTELVGLALAFPPGWESIETFPQASEDKLEVLELALSHDHPPTVVAELQGALAVALYWSAQAGIGSDGVDATLARRDELTASAIAALRSEGDPRRLVVAILRRLFACWSPRHRHERQAFVAEIEDLLGSAEDPEAVRLRLEADQWRVLELLDQGRGHEADRAIADFHRRAEAGGLVLFERRAALWRACRHVQRGEIDTGVALNEQAVSSTAEVAGASFAFQNVAVTLAIERYFRRELRELIEPIRSVAASSPRVSVNWQVALAFALAEVGELDRARPLFSELVADDCAAIPADLNWLVTVYLLALTAVHLEDRDAGRMLGRLLEPFGSLDATHGFGYASYGPVARPLAQLAALDGDLTTARAWAESVLDTRGAGPWTALTRLDLARVLAPDDAEAALMMATSARTALQGYAMAAWAQAAEDLVLDLHRRGARGGLARLAGQGWTLTHQTGTAAIGDTVGARYLVELLSRPGETVAATDLEPASGSRGGHHHHNDHDDHLGADGAAEALVDRRAEAEYRRRLDELERRAVRRGWTDEASREATILRQTLAAARRPAASRSAEQERARVRVTKALRRTLASIGDEAPALGQYLAGSLETGRTCLFSPTDGQAWLVVDTTAQRQEADR